VTNHPLARRALEFGGRQKGVEFSELLRLLEQKDLHAVVEIGTLFGGTLICWCQLADHDAVLVSVDRADGLATPERLQEMRTLFPKGEQRLELVRNDSHDPATLDQVKDVLGKTPVDFLFIDGDHTYEGVKQDFEMYSPLVKDGGLIVLHDILEHRNIPDCRVSDFWLKIKPQYRHLEFTSPPWHWGGIGVIWQERAS
jgi:predicted O-methyltransferase YrrM